MTRRARIAVLFALVATLLTGANPASSDPPGSVSSYYLARADPRLCPSPMCGGLWINLVNKSATRCGDGAARRECYVAEADLSGLSVDEKGRVQLQRLITEGRALARGRLLRGRIDGFPELDILVVSEVWTASSSQTRARGLFHRLRDNGVRCITTPCFSIHAAVLNVGRHLNVSNVNLASTGAPAWERRAALAQIARPGLIAAGRVVRTPNAGPAGDGRTFVATQFYARAAR